MKLLTKGVLKVKPVKVEPVNLRKFVLFVSCLVA